MSPVLTRPQPRSAAALIRRDVLIVVLAFAGSITALAGIDAALRGPDFVDRVTVVNDGPYLADIEVANNSRDGWLALGPVSPDERHDFGSVVEQGEHWIFHVSTGPYDGGEFSLSRNELEQEHWRITIPPEVHRRLETNGAVPFPSR